VETSGKVEFVLNRVACEAGEPVVRVDGFEGIIEFPIHHRQDPGGELVDHFGQALLGHGAERPGGDVMDLEAGFDHDHRCEGGIPGPGEDIATRTRARHGGRQLAHVDIHATTISRARLGKG